LGTIYPKENLALAEAILESGGALISEYPVGTNGHRSHFVARNRIISGLSEGVIVFEADEKSGTMHTARFAYSQGKKIFCPNITTNGEMLSTGVQKLLNTESALPITNGRDLIKNLFVIENDYLSIKIKPSTVKALESISKNKGLSVEELIDSLIINFIEGERGYE
jgi:DNA processing protein